MTTNTAPTKDITYVRSTRDYDAYLDGQYIGSYPTHHDAEVALDQVYRDQIASGLTHTVAELDGGAPEAVVPVVPVGPEVVIGRMRWNEKDQEFRIDPSIPAYECERCNQYRTLHRRGNTWLCDECDECDAAGLERLGQAVWGECPDLDGGEPVVRRSAGFMTGECANCNTVQRVYDDGEAYVCVAYEQCQDRQHAHRLVAAGRCGACAGPHPAYRCPRIGALLMRHIEAGELVHPATQPTDAMRAIAA